LPVVHRDPRDAVLDRQLGALAHVSPPCLVGCVI
jgi:hypothetical protein